MSRLLSALLGVISGVQMFMGDIPGATYSVLAAICAVLWSIADELRKEATP